MQDDERSSLLSPIPEQKPRPFRMPTAAENLWYHKRTASEKKRSNKRKRRCFIHRVKQLSCPYACFLEQEESKTHELRTTSMDDSNVVDEHSNHYVVPFLLSDEEHDLAVRSQRGSLGDESSSNTFLQLPVDQYSKNNSMVLEESFRVDKLLGEEKNTLDDFAWDPPFPDPCTIVTPTRKNLTKGGEGNDTVTTQESPLTDMSSSPIAAASNNTLLVTTTTGSPEMDADTEKFDISSPSSFLRRQSSVGLMPLPSQDLSVVPSSPVTTFEDSISWASSNSTIKIGQQQQKSSSSSQSVTAALEAVFPLNQNVFCNKQEDNNDDKPKPEKDEIQVSLSTNQESTVVPPAFSPMGNLDQQKNLLFSTTETSLPDVKGEYQNGNVAPKYSPVGSGEPRPRRTNFLPLPCICGRGRECCGVSAAFYMLEDPRGGFTKVPKRRKDTHTHYGVVMNRLRACLLRNLLPPELVDCFDDSSERQYIANHHFHPDLVHWSANGQRCEIPIFISAREVKSLGLELTEECRILDEKQMPTDGYFVVANYSFDQAKQDLKWRVKVQKIIGEKKINRKKERRRTRALQESAKGRSVPTVVPVRGTLEEEKENRSSQPMACDDAGFPIPPPTRLDTLRNNKRASLDKFNTLSSNLSEALKTERDTGDAQAAQSATEVSDDSASEMSISEGQGAFPIFAVNAGEHRNDDNVVHQDSSSTVMVTNVSSMDDATREDNDDEHDTDRLDNAFGDMSAFQLSLPPKPASVNLNAEEKAEMNEKLSEFESQRRSAYAMKLTEANVRWRSSLDGFEAGLNQTASAEHWVYEASNATQTIVQDALLGSEGHGSPCVDSAAGNGNFDSAEFATGSLPVFSGYVSSCIAEELSRARPEFEAKVNDMEQMGKRVFGELELAEAKVTNAWNAYKAVAIAPLSGSESDTSASSRGRSAGSRSSSSSSTDLWAVQMRYRVSVANQSLDWKRWSAKLCNLFESVDKTDKERREWLRGLLVEVVSRTPASAGTQTPIEKIKEIIDAVEKSPTSPAPGEGGEAILDGESASREHEGGEPLLSVDHPLDSESVTEAPPSLGPSESGPEGTEAIPSIRWSFSEGAEASFSSDGCNMDVSRVEAHALPDHGKGDEGPVEGAEPPLPGRDVLVTANGSFSEATEPRRSEGISLTLTGMKTLPSTEHTVSDGSAEPPKSSETATQTVEAVPLPEGSSADLNQAEALSSSEHSVSEEAEASPATDALPTTGFTLSDEAESRSSPEKSNLTPTEAKALFSMGHAEPPRVSELATQTLEAVPSPEGNSLDLNRPEALSSSEHAVSEGAEASLKGSDPLPPATDALPTSGCTLPDETEARPSSEESNPAPTVAKSLPPIEHAVSEGSAELPRGNEPAAESADAVPSQEDSCSGDTKVSPSPAGNESAAEAHSSPSPEHEVPKGAPPSPKHKVSEGDGGAPSPSGSESAGVGPQDPPVPKVSEPPPSPKQNESATTVEDCSPLQAKGTALPEARRASFLIKGDELLLSETMAEI